MRVTGGLCLIHDGARPFIEEDIHLPCNRYVQKETCCVQRDAGKGYHKELMRRICSRIPAPKDYMDDTDPTGIFIFLIREAYEKMIADAETDVQMMQW